MASVLDKTILEETVLKDQSLHLAKEWTADEQRLTKRLLKLLTFFRTTQAAFFDHEKLALSFFLYLTQTLLFFSIILSIFFIEEDG